MPKLFLGSSTEARPQAELCADFLSRTADVVPWWKAPSFVPLSGTLDALISSAQEYDFGLFLLTPDDSTESRGTRGHTSRDNVLFELGLFLGELGRDRCFAFVQHGPSRKRVRMPSDLAGLTIPRINGARRNALQESLRNACNQLQHVVRSKSFRSLDFGLIDGWSYDVDRGKFRVALSERLVAEHFHRLQHRCLALVIRRSNDAIDRNSDQTVIIGASRPIPREPQRIVIEVACKRLLRLTGDPRLDGHLFLLPAAARRVRRPLHTIDEILAIGGRLIETKGRRIDVKE